MTDKQEAALRDYLQEAIMPLIEQVLVKKLGQAMSFAAKELIQPKPAEQEPVAWYGVNIAGVKYLGWKYEELDDRGFDVFPLYTSPRPAQPSKPWVDLTQQDIDIAFDDTQEGGGFNEFAYAIEAKLKEKNA